MSRFACKSALGWIEEGRLQQLPYLHSVSLQTRSTSDDQVYVLYQQAGYSTCCNQQHARCRLPKQLKNKFCNGGACWSLCTMIHEGAPGCSTMCYAVITMLTLIYGKLNCLHATLAACDCCFSTVEFEREANSMEHRLCKASDACKHRSKKSSGGILPNGFMFLSKCASGPSAKYGLPTIQHVSQCWKNGKGELH